MSNSNFNEQVDYNSSFDVRPALDKQLVKINSTCLYTNSQDIEDYILFGWTVQLIFWAALCPYLIYSSVNLIYGLFTYESHPAVIESLPYTIFYFALKLVIFPTIIFGLSAGIIKSLGKLSFYCFDRQQQKVFAIVKGKLYQDNWKNIKAELTEVTRIYGYRPIMTEVTKLYLYRTEDAEKSHPAIISATNNDVYSGDGNKMVWQSISTFMNKGPDDVIIISKYAGNRDIGQNKLFYNFSESIKKRKFWPAYNKNDSTNVILYDIVFWPLRALLYIPNILTDITWRKLVLFILGHEHEKNFYPMIKQCDNHWITPDSIKEVLLPGENSVTYQEAVKRGALK